jgi:hypothetical protein
LGEVEEGDELAYADLAGVLSEHVDELQADGVAQRLGDRGHAFGLMALHVGVDDGLAAGLPGRALLFGSELQIDGHQIYVYRLKLRLSIRWDLRRRLVHQDADVGLSDRPSEDVYELVTVVLNDLGDGRTEMPFEQRGRMSAEQYKRAGEGWSTFFDRMKEHLAGA